MIVEVVYGTPKKQRLVELTLAEGCTAREAAMASALDQDFDDLDLASAPIGIFGQKTTDTQVLNAGDRVEIYRPLQIDPKEARRARADKNKK